MSRIGIFSGTFDPVHKGHVAFALQAIESAKLDKVYFAPEPKPRRKQGVTHIAHRDAMLKLVTKPHPKLDVLSLPDKQFVPLRTTARLKKEFPDAELVLLLGSDLLEHLDNWPSYAGMLKHMGLVIGVRAHSDTAKSLEKINKLVTPVREIHIIESTYPLLSSRRIRESLHKGAEHEGLPESVSRYANEHWLYVSAN